GAGERHEAVRPGPGARVARRSTDAARSTHEETSVMATTPRQVIDAVVRSVCGHEVEQLVRLTSGGVHETYRGELAAAGSVVVRIGRQPVPWFTDEGCTQDSYRNYR